MQHVIQLSPVAEVTLTVTTFSVACLKLWVWLQRTLAAEQARTLRLLEALRNVHGRDRAEVVRACAELEAAIGTGATQPQPGTDIKAAIEPRET
jgi:hypothetical protein